MKYIKTSIGEGFEEIMDKDEKEEFINEYLADKETEAYCLDDGCIAYAGEEVIAGVQGKYFKNLEEYGAYLAEYHGYNILKLPHIRKERI